jgi:hypothetical protein
MSIKNFGTGTSADELGRLWKTFQKEKLKKTAERNENYRPGNRGITLKKRSLISK